MNPCTKLLRLPKGPHLVRGAAKAAGSSKPAKPPAPKLPSFPVPELNSTLSRFLRSARPFLSCEEYCKSEAIVNEFGTPAGEGEQLHFHLIEKAKKADNWLKDYWLRAAYLEFRAPVVVHSSPAEVFPKQKFDTEQDMLKCAANIVAHALTFKQLVDEEKLPEEKLMGKPVDMAQYKKFFGTTRIPMAKCDVLSYNPCSEHIIVMHNNIVYKMKVKQGGNWVPSGVLYEQFVAIVSLDNCPAPPVGALTADNRDNWAEMYKELRKNEGNCRTLKDIEEALFAVCLDLICPPQGINDMTTGALQLLHGGGPTVNGGNRWFDKTIQFVIGRDGTIGITYEHSPAEGAPIAVLTDHIVERLHDKVECGMKVTEELKPLKLVFHLNNKLKDGISTAQCNFNTLVNDVELVCFSFKDFGKDSIKMLKLSPDSFIQMAIQYTFYRIHKVPGAQYESASLRMFKEGRTETIRSCSLESVRFAKAMLDGCVPVQSKANALRVAVNAHKEYTIAAVTGNGADRHLLGLKMAAKDNCVETPKIFSDPAFLRSSHMRISTSQVASKSDSFMVYGPSVPDGYGCCYNPRNDNINFGMSAFVSCDETDALKFRQMLEASLNEMKDVLVKAPVSKL